MGVLDRFEGRLDRLVNGAFAKAFKAEVQPVELASALQREMDEHAAVVTRSRTVAPNTFEIDLSDRDHERLQMYADTITAELANVVTEYAQEQRYQLAGRVQITLEREPDLQTGLFRVRSSSTAGGPGASRPSSVTPSATAPALIVAGVAHPLTEAVTRIGRGSEVELRVDDPGVSRVHFEVILGPRILVRDLGSTNGTYVGGVAVRETELKDGDQIRAGGTAVTFRAGTDR